MSFLRAVNTAISVLFFVCYSYQLVYLLIPLVKRDRPRGPVSLRRYAVLIAARNEEAVIGSLIESIKSQDYPAELVSVFVVADNCTDNTADIARQAGAAVYERFDAAHVGKGCALDFLLGRIKRDYGDVFDGYFVFDADNLLSPGYISAMNRKLGEGYRVVTSLRNSKNYGDNWISAGYALWFLRESEFLNHARTLCGHSAAVSGTGFLMDREIVSRNGGWPFHLLTEDIEFTENCVVSGEKIGYAPDAEFFDEQPVRFSQSWYQRLRWAKGYLQVFGRYGGRLAKSAARGSFSAFDMSMTILPAMVLSIVCMALNAAAALPLLLSGAGLLPVLSTLLKPLAGSCAFLLFIGAFTTAAQWRKIHAPAAKKVLYTLTFPLFMLTYIPITVAALFQPVEWRPIEHKAALSIKDLV